MTALRIVTILLLAASIQAQPVDLPPSIRQLRRWVDDGCVRSGKRVGIDYRGALERAIYRERAGLSELFRYTVIGEMDGGAGESHAAILFGLLQRWGDRGFASVLRAQKPDVRHAVIDNITMSPDTDLKFPLTYASKPR